MLSDPVYPVYLTRFIENRLANSDLDNDSFTPADGDCDDSNFDVTPFAFEVPDDGIDNNRNGEIDEPAGPPPMPDFPFSLKDQNGNEVSLVDFYDRGVILHLCAGWCTPCQQFSGDISKSIVGKELVQTIMIEGLQQGLASNQQDAQIWGSSFLVDSVLHMDGSAADAQFFLDNYFEGVFPTFVFIDRNLNIVGKLTGIPGSDADWQPLVDLIRNTP